MAVTSLLVLRVRFYFAISLSLLLLMVDGMPTHIAFIIIVVADTVHYYIMRLDTIIMVPGDLLVFYFSIISFIITVVPFNGVMIL